MEFTDPAVVPIFITIAITIMAFQAWLVWFVYRAIDRRPLLPRHYRDVSVPLYQMPHRSFSQLSTIFEAEEEV